MTARRRQLQRAAIAAARAAGCTCAAAATVQHDRDGFARVQVEHDDHCPLLRAHEGAHGPDTAKSRSSRNDSEQRLRPASRSSPR